MPSTDLNGAKRRGLRVLIDMDGVLCDFEKHVFDMFKQKYPNDPCIPLENRRHFYVADDYEALQKKLNSVDSKTYSSEESGSRRSPTLVDKCRGLMYEEGFFRDMPEIEGAITALKEMSMINGVELFICTTPMIDIPMHSTKYCLQEKEDWVKLHFGPEWAKRVILTHDKTVVYGDLLIDDKPCITGSVTKPSWEHVMFSACHNIHAENCHNTTARRRLENWKGDSWKPIINEYLERLSESEIYQ